MGGKTLTMSTDLGIYPIYYTLDGTEPTFSSNIYSTPLSLTLAGTYTVIFADYEGGRLNNIASAAVDAQVAGEESVSVQGGNHSGNLFLLFLRTFTYGFLPDGV